MANPAPRRAASARAAASRSATAPARSPSTPRSRRSRRREGIGNPPALAPSATMRGRSTTARSAEARYAVSATSLAKRATTTKRATTRKLPDDENEKESALAFGPETTGPRNTPATTVSARFHTLSAYVARVSSATMPAGSARPNGEKNVHREPRPREGEALSVVGRLGRLGRLGLRRPRVARDPRVHQQPRVEELRGDSRGVQEEKRRQRRQRRRRDVQDVFQRPVRHRGDDAERGPYVRDDAPVHHATPRDDPSERARRAARRRLAPLRQRERQRVADPAPSLGVRRRQFRRGQAPQPPGARRAAHRRGFLARDRHRDVVEHAPPRLRRESPDPVRDRRGPGQRQRGGDARVGERNRAADVGGVQSDDARQKHVEHQKHAHVPPRASSSAPRVRKAGFRVGGDPRRLRQRRHRTRARLRDERQVRLKGRGAQRGGERSCAEGPRDDRRAG